MRISFKVSLSTLIFSCYIIISASFMVQLLDFIRYDLWIPKKLELNYFKNKILSNVKKQDEVQFITNIYSNYKNGYLYKNKKLSKDDKIDTRVILLKAGQRDILPFIVWGIFAIFGLLLIIYLIKIKISLYRLLLLLIFVGLGVLYAYTLNKYISERIHLIYFGVLGFLFTRANLIEKRLFVLIYVIFFALLLASLDEVFQLFLPYRVGDVRDIIFGAAGGLWGALIYTTINLKNNKTKSTIP